MFDSSKKDIVFLPVRFSRNELSHIIDAADPDLTDRSNLKYFLEILIPKFPLSTEFMALHRSEGRERPVGTNGSVSLYEGADFTYNDRKGKLDGQLTLVKPEFRQTAMRQSVTQTMPYKLREIVTGGVDTDKTGPTQWIAKAGVSPEHVYGYEKDFFSEYQQRTRMFLTWSPDIRTVGLSEEIYLSFMLNVFPVPQTLKLRLKCLRTDGNYTETVTVGELAGLTQYGVITCPVGPAVLDLPEDCESYQVWLSDENDLRISAIRTYVLDDAYRPFERYILFANSLGGWDTIRFTGESMEKLKVSQVAAERNKRAGEAVDYPERLIVSTEAERELTVSTGYFERGSEMWLRYLDELILSEEIYLVSEQGHEPLQRITNELTDWQDNVYLQSRSFTFVKQSKIQNFSQLPAKVPESRATTWQGQDYRHVLDAQGKRSGKMTATRLRKVYADDNTDVKPLTLKPNMPGDVDYQKPIFSPEVVVGFTPYPSAAISRKTSFNRTTCGNGYYGGPALIVIEAGAYGGESPGNGDALAEAEYQRKNTQEYTNEWGVCDNSPQNYAADVPVGNWRYRSNKPDPTLVCDGSINPTQGNAWFLSGSNAYKYPAWSNDLNFPAPATGWRFGFYHAGPITVKIYVNGQLTDTKTQNPNQENYSQFTYAGTLQSGDRLYLERSDV
ncbi:DUF5977 domain-containing protein [Siphonobacter sp. SORGH_AS_0500]|uniref:DUF5977 domain-containing protein n=1 Tax=Siphonobacter sp. SORGH_AS_0500 TaxID=1864824 RepID=UPI00285E6A03|nr:hypothetical protein [Siphonobacter sp. SORGH_AS_0500]MDR6195925.1 hypothetical protein [Siphonobacter sp. SORGH_AS_0500]